MYILYALISLFVKDSTDGPLEWKSSDRKKDGGWFIESDLEF